MSTALIIPQAQFGGDRRPPERRRPLEKTNPYNTKTKPRVLIVDDEHLIADTLAEILNDKGFEVVAVYDGRSALEHLREFCPDILITDVVMPGMNGIDLAKSVRAACAATRVVLLSGQAATKDLIARARQQGYSFELWAKPIAPEILLERLREK